MEVLAVVASSIEKEDNELLLAQSKETITEMIVQHESQLTQSKKRKRFSGVRSPHLEEHRFRQWKSSFDDWTTAEWCRLSEKNQTVLQQIDVYISQHIFTNWKFSSKYLHFTESRNDVYGLCYQWDHNPRFFISFGELQSIKNCSPHVEEIGLNVSGSMCIRMGDHPKSNDPECRMVVWISCIDEDFILLPK